MVLRRLFQQPVRARRLPALVAFGFGLVHGLGFAGALEEVGLPQNQLLPALLTFNIGVEIGQLLTVAAAFGLTRVIGRQPWAAALPKPVLYGIGAVASYWSWLRIATILS